MIRFIWKNWWRNKQRFLLLIVGALIVSSGLSFLVGIAQTNKGTVVDELQKRWKASYDIVVRPPGTRSVTETKHLLEPNYLSGLSGGISLKQFHQIKTISDISVAAPIAMIGYTNPNVTMKTLNLPTKKGIYRVTETDVTDTGATTIKDGGKFYFTIGDWAPKGLGKEYGVGHFQGEVGSGPVVLLAGVDPIEEEKLVGLKDAVIHNNRYFAPKDKVSSTTSAGKAITQIPVLFSNQEFTHITYRYNIQRLDLPFANVKEQDKTMEMVKKEGGNTFLNTVKAGSVKSSTTFTSGQIHQKMMDALRIGNASVFSQINPIWAKPTPVKYKPVTSPFSSRWPFAYDVKPYTMPSGSLLPIKESYRPVHIFGDGKNTRSMPWVAFNFVGVFNPSKLKISKDPLTELPAETYFPAKASLVLDQNNNPVNPVRTLYPEDSMYGFLTKPPTMLTTIDAAAKILGKKPISTIRIKVKGVTTLNDQSEKKLKAVAKEIRDKTGLITDITLGSSPQPALTHIPGLEGKPALGWVQQPWIKLGSSVVMFAQARLGLSGIIATVILVGIIYFFSSNLIALYARKKEFAVLLAMGWRPVQLSRLIFTEATLMGLFVTFVSWLMLGLTLMFYHPQTSILRILLIGIMGLGIYWLGAIIPSLLARRIQPYETIQQGDISQHGRHWFRISSIPALSFNYLIKRWKRSLLSIIAIALPSSLLIVLLFITFKLKGIMYTTWLGQYVAMKVGPMQYLAMGISLVIAILTTGEIIWQNISERQPELALFKAVGWKNRSIRLLVLMEGAFTGLVAGIAGLVIAWVILLGMYKHVPIQQFSFFLLTLLIPVITGLIGAVIPAERAVKIMPYQGLHGMYDNSRQTERGFKWMIGTVAAVLLIGFISLVISAVPEIKQSLVHSTHVNGTKGNVVQTTAKNKQTKKSKKTTNQPVNAALANPYKTVHLGETVKAKNGDYTITFGHQVKIAKKPANNMTYLSIPINLTIQTEGRVYYKPYYFKLYDEKGHAYTPLDYKVKESNNWIRNHTMIVGPGKANVVLTYKVPKTSKHLKLLVDSIDLVPGSIVVNIK